MTDLSGVQCPNHRYGQVTFTCVRCGTFGCNACRSLVAGPLCSACGARASAQGLPVIETLLESLQFLQRRPPVLLALAGVYALYGLMLVLLAKHPWVLAAMNLTLSSVAEVFLVRYIGDQLEDPANTMGDSLSNSAENILPGLGSNFLASLAVGLGLVACILPGVFVFVALCLAIPALVLHNASVTESLNVAWVRSEGYRWPLLGLLGLCSVIAIGLGIGGAIVELVFKLLGRPGVVLGTMASQSTSGPILCLFTTVLTFSYLKIAGVWTGERQTG